MTANGQVFVTIPTPQGNVTLPRAQVEALIACCDAIRDDGERPLWHVNKCGCCVSVHSYADPHRGYLIGADGEFDYVEVFDHDE